MPKSALLPKTPQFLTSAKGSVPNLMPINVSQHANNDDSSIDKDLLAAQIKINADNMDLIEKMRKENEEIVKFFEQAKMEKEHYRAKLEKTEQKLSFIQKKMSKDSTVIQKKNGQQSRSKSHLWFARNTTICGIAK